MTLARPEPMSDAFSKFHLDNGVVLHRFIGIDEQFHDHPFSIDIQVLAGGYVEDVLDIETLAIRQVLRQPGDCFTITATHVHRIPRLLTDECWTVAPAPGTDWADPQDHRHAA